MSDAARVEVRCLATLAPYQPEAAVPVAAGETPAALARRLGIPSEEVNLALVNGERAPWDAPLKDGDRVSFVPLVGGG